MHTVTANALHVLKEGYLLLLTVSFQCAEYVYLCLVDNYVMHFYFCNQTSDQSEITRLSWSPDGSLIVAPHATNNKFPTAQLINRSTWKPGLDLVGHEKHVVCAVSFQYDLSVCSLFSRLCKISFAYLFVSLTLKHRNRLSFEMHIWKS